MMSGDSGQMIAGLATAGAGLYCVAFTSDGAVYGWVLGLFGAWLCLSLHPWFRDGLLDVNTYVSGSCPDPGDDLFED